MSPQDRADLIEDWMLSVHRGTAAVNDMQLLQWVLQYDNGLCIRIHKGKPYASGLPTATVFDSKPDDLGIENGHGERPIPRQIWDARIRWLEDQDAGTGFMVDSIALNDTKGPLT